MQKSSVLGTLLFVLFLSGCSDGQTGDKGVLRFSLILNFTDTNGMSAPIAQKSSLLIELERASERSDNAPDMTLEVKPIQGGVARSFPLGFSQYGLYFEDPGSYQLVGKQGDREVDTFTVHVEPIDHLTFSEFADVRTEFQEGLRKCHKMTSVPVNDVVLKPNQSAEFTLVPISKDGGPMLGLLPASVVGPDFLNFDAATIGEGRKANALRVLPAGKLGQSADIHVLHSSGVDLPFVLQTSNEPAPGECPAN